MSNNNSAAFAAITEQLNPAARYVSHAPMAGGVSAEIYLLEYTLPGTGHHKAVVRCHSTAAWKQQQDNVTQTEFALQTALHTQGLKVARTVFLDVSGTRLASPYFVMDFVAGSSEVASHWLPDALAQMATFLSTLHQLHTQELPALPRGDDPLAGALRYLPVQPAYAELRQALERWPLRPATENLLHGDYWPGNLLWQDGQLAAVIDWEDASLGPALSDLAGCRCELMVIYGEAAMQRFTRLYLNDHAIDLRDLPIWELYAGFAALDSLSAWGLPASEEAQRRARTTQFVSRAAAEVLAAGT